MKKLLIFLGLFLSVGIFAQTYPVKVFWNDIVIKGELTVRDSTIIELIQQHGGVFKSQTINESVEILSDGDNSVVFYIDNTSETTGSYIELYKNYTTLGAWYSDNGLAYFEAGISATEPYMQLVISLNDLSVYTIQIDGTGMYYVDETQPDYSNVTNWHFTTKGYADLSYPYTIFVQADGASPTDATTVYFCSTPQPPATNENNRAVIALQDGTITGANIIMNTTAGNAGSGEDISVYVRINNTTDYLVATVGTTDGRRIFSNYALDIDIAQDDIIIIKVVYPTWATDPTNVHWSGNLLIRNQ